MEAQSTPESSQCKHNTFIGTSNPRWLRVIAALLKRSVMREQLDKIAGASNSPDIILNLRRHGLQIPCKRIPIYDQDNKLCRAGVYELSKSDRIKISKWLKRRELI